MSNPFCLIKVSKQTFKGFLVLLTLLVFSSCGGGGGGGSSGPSNGKSAATGIRIINAALDYPALQINSAEAGVVSKANFSEVAYHGALSSGSVNLVVTTSANALAGLWSGGTELSKNQHKSILVYGGYANKDLAFALLNDAGIEPPDGQAAVRVINGVSGSAPLVASAVGLPSTSAASVGTSSEYIFIPAGTYEFSVSSGNSVIGKVSGVVESGGSYSVVSYGAAGYFVTSNLLQD